MEFNVNDSNQKYIWKNAHVLKIFNNSNKNNVKLKCVWKLTVTGLWCWVWFSSCKGSGISVVAVTIVISFLFMSTEKRFETLK